MRWTPWRTLIRVLESGSLGSKFDTEAFIMRRCVRLLINAHCYGVLAASLFIAVAEA